jgi:hypothetical protein
MAMRSIFRQLGLAFLAVAIGAAGARAQQSQDQQGQDQGQSQNQGAQQNQDQAQQPIPAYRSPMAGVTGNDNDENTSPDSYVPDTTPLAGASSILIGVPRESRSYWQPSLSGVVTVDSNAGDSASGGWVTYGTVLGSVDLRIIRGISDLNLSYLGGGTFSNSSYVGDSVVQVLGVRQRFVWHRNALMFSDSFSYLPEAGFGYGAAIGVLPGVTTGTGSTGLTTGFAPGTSILTTTGQQISNSSVAQFTRRVSHRGTLTLLGGYSFLHYIDNGLLNYSDISAQGGYDYQISPQNTIAVIYRFDQDRYNYTTNLPTINNHTAQLSYGRRVTGRLAFHAAGGVELSYYPASILGLTGTATTQYINWSANAGLTYKLEHANLGITYSHWVSPGSGVFVGAITDQVSASLTRQLSRVATLNLNGGFARNKALDIVGAPGANQIYDYSYVGANFMKPLSRTVRLNFNYQFQYQTSNLGFCIGVACGSSYTANIISAGLNWIARPITIE